MKILVDTNIILDIILERQPFFARSAQVLQTALQSNIKVYITATTVTDLYYIVRKAKDKELALNFIKELLDFVDVSAVDKSVILQALQLDMTDFEDAIQASSAKSEAIQIIVTRNEVDFAHSDLTVYTPESFLNNVTSQ